MARILLGALLASWSSAQEPPPPAPPPVAAAEPITLGTPPYRFAWVPGWGRLGDGKELGGTHGCLVVDGDGNILANTDTEHAVIVFSPEGRVLRSWGRQFHGGLHGMCLIEEPNTAGEPEQRLWLAHTRRHEVVKTTMAGEVLATIGWPEASGIYQNEGQYQPTAVAVGPDGRVFVADGYGKSWVHLFDREHRYVKSFAGPGEAPGKTRTPHGLWLDQRGKQPLLLVCDRENHRLQWFTMDGEYVRSLATELRRPCNVAPLPDGGLVVADLTGRVTVFDREDKFVCHLGENPDPKQRAQHGVPRDQWQDGVFLAPHGICVDGDGAIYVQDWNFLGRISKLERVGQPSLPFLQDAFGK